MAMLEMGMFAATVLSQRLHHQWGKPTGNLVQWHDCSLMNI